MKALPHILWLLLLPASAAAQVVIHQTALDQLAGIAPAAPIAAAPPAPVGRHIHRSFIHRRMTAPVAVAFQAPPPPPDLNARPAPILPASARPAPANIAPVLAPKAVPAIARPAPPPALALQFAAGSSALPGNAAAALKPVCAAAEPSGMVSINAGAGTGVDPSTAMRLSMARAFAVRDALAACGVSPARIIPRALGPGTGDAARVTLGTAP